MTELRPEVKEIPQEPVEEAQFCTVHPSVETALRCNKCGRPMCNRCAVRTPVGYRCKECVRGQQDVFFNIREVDYVIAGAVAVVLGVLAGSIVPRFGLFFGIILSPVAGTIIAQAAHTVTGRRRGRYKGLVVAGGVLAGLIPSLWQILQFAVLGAPVGALLQLLLLPGVFAIIAASVAYSWFR